MLTSHRCTIFVIIRFGLYVCVKERVRERERAESGWGGIDSCTVTVLCVAHSAGQVVLSMLVVQQ